MSIRYVDRSRTLTYQECPRKRYWAYESYGRGIQPVRMSIPLVVGQCVHEGLATLLEYHTDDKVGAAGEYSENRTDIAVMAALYAYDTEVRARGLTLDENEEAIEVFDEQKALIEALIRVWALRRLPGFLEQFEVLEVEREDQFSLSKLYNPFNPEPVGEIVWMSRADGLLRERSTGDLYVLSFKTASEWNNFKDKEARIDMQGMSELYSIEQRLEREWKGNWAKYHKGKSSLDEVPEESAPKLAGVQMEYLIKGRRSKDKETGAYVQDSILIRPWMRDDGGLVEPQWAWKYWTHCEGPHVTAGGKKCNGDANHSLGPKWNRVPVWEHMPIKEWIRMLDQGEIQGEEGDPLEGLIMSPMPYYRHEDEVESWRIQIQSQEEHVATLSARAQEVQEKDNTAMFKMTLDGLFPQHRESCYKYGEKFPCAYLDVCFGNIGDPLESGLYQLRQAHHQPEKEAFENES